MVSGDNNHRAGEQPGYGSSGASDMRRNPVLACFFVTVLLSVGAAAQSRSDIWAEALVAREQAYVREPVIYTIRVYSGEALDRIEVVPPGTQGVSVEELDGPHATAREIGGRRYIVNEIRYAITPMVPGGLRIGAATLRVTPRENSSFQGGYERAFGGLWPQTPAGRGANRSVELSTGDVNFYALAPATTTTPWLPLQHLEIKTRWGDGQPVRAGEPLALTVTVKGRGATGAQLPNIAPLLQSPDFKVYPERARTEWKFGRNNKSLWGRRTEAFTVVPTREGTLEFPAIQLKWWDLTGGVERFAGVPARRVVAAQGHVVRQPTLPGRGEEALNPGQMVSAADRKIRLSYIFIAGTVALAAFGFGWWWGSGRRASRQGEHEARGPLLALRTKARGVPAMLSTKIQAVLPANILRATERLKSGWRSIGARALGMLLTLLPARGRIWWCSRCVGSAADAAGLCGILRRFACEHFRMSPTAPLQAIAERVLRGRPPPKDEVALRRLFRELDDAVYGRGSLDAIRWKRQFVRRFRRVLWHSAHPGFASAGAGGLPALNP